MQVRFVSTVLILISATWLSAANRHSGATPTTILPNVSVRLHPDFSTPEVFSGSIPVARNVTLVAASISFFTSRNKEYKLSNPASELTLISQSQDNLGFSHLKFQQKVGDVQIWGCQVITHFDVDRKLYMTAGQILPTPQISLQPTISSGTARRTGEKAARAFGATGKLSSTGQIVILPIGNEPVLAWHVVITNEGGTIVRYRVFVDAQNGNVLQEYNDVQSDGPTIGSGPDSRDSIRTIYGYVDGGVNKMISTVKPMFVPPVSSLTGVIASLIGVLDQSAVAEDLNSDNNWNDNDSLKAAISAHYYASATYDYYLSTFGRNSYNGIGGSLYLVVLDNTVANAAWYGNGVVRFRAASPGYDLPWSASLDVVAHEVTHGVTETSAGLIYSFQSGALNESYSDFFGAMVDRDDWYLGEELFLSPGWFVRDFANPHHGNQPDRMSEYQMHPLSYDNGGVHINSGIPNRAGYLVAAAIGRDKAEHIWYRTLTNYLTPSSSMYFWADMTSRAAADLYGQGSPEVMAVEAAMDSIEIGYVYTSPSEIASFTVQAGTLRDTSIFVCNRSLVPVTVLGASSTLGFVSVLESFPISIAGRDSAQIHVRADASTADACDMGTNTGALQITTNAPIFPLFSMPIVVNVGLAQTTYHEDFCFANRVYLGVTNTPLMTSYRHTPAPGEAFYYNGLFEGSLMVGLIDGADTVVYHNRGPAAHPFAAVDESAVRLNAGGYYSRSFQMGSSDGRIHGRVSYSYAHKYRIEDNESVIVDYLLTNPCDTALHLLTGVVCDFDVLADPLANTAGYDSDRAMVYVVGSDTLQVLGMACLSNQPRNLLSIKNSEWVWPSGNTLESGDAYRLMDSVGNTVGTSPDDWSSILTFGETVLQPGDSVLYRFAMLYGVRGVEDLKHIADHVYPVFDSLGLFVDPALIEVFVGDTPSSTLPDSQIVVNFIGSGAVSWQASCKAPWLQVLNPTGTTGQTVGVRFLNQSLSPGTYIDTIRIESPEAYGGHELVKVRLTVHSGDGVREVPQEYATIQDAVNSAVDGETILVGPGNYSLNLVITDKRLKFISSQGPESTILTLANPSPPLIRFDLNRWGWSELAGFTITGPMPNSGILMSDRASVSIHNNIFRNLVAAQEAPGRIVDVVAGNCHVYENLFFESPSLIGVTVQQELDDIVCVIGNTFDNLLCDIDVTGQRIVMRSNLTSNCLMAMYANDKDSIRNNDLWSNDHCFTYPYTDTIPGNFYVDPLYCLPEAGDYRLQGNSPCLPGHLISGLIGADLGNCSDLACGDPNYDHLVTISDAVYMINYIFAGGPSPIGMKSGDVDCSGLVTISDVVYLINYIFAGGVSPCTSCP